MYDAVCLIVNYLQAAVISHTVSPHHCLSVSLSVCLHSWGWSLSSHTHTPAAQHTHFLSFFFLPWCDISPQGISSSSRPSAPHLPLLNPVYFCYTAIITHIYRQTHTHTSQSRNPIYLWCGIIHCCRCVTGQRTHQTWCQGECVTEGEEQIGAGLVTEENDWVVCCGFKFKIGLNSLSGWCGDDELCYTIKRVQHKWFYCKVVLLDGIMVRCDRTRQK